MTTKDYCSINFTGLTHDHTLECGGQLANSTRDDVDENGQVINYCSAIPILKQHPMYDCLVLVRKYRNCLAGYSLEFPIDKIREHERLPTNESAAHHHNYQQQQQEQQHEQAIASDASINDINLTHQDGAERGVESNSGATMQSNNSDGIYTTGRSACSQKRLVSRFLDGDDPVYRGCTIGHVGGTGPTTGCSSTGGPCEHPAPIAPTSGAVVGNVKETTVASNLSQTDETDARLLFMAQIDDRGDQCHLVHVPINGLLDRLESYTRNGIAVDSRVYAFAMGLKTAERMMTTKSMKELHETPI